MQEVKNRILLIFPPYIRLYNKNLSMDTYPLSLGYLAGAIKKHSSWSVLVYNADFVSKHNRVNVPNVGNLTYLFGEGFKNYTKNLENLSNPIWNEVRTSVKSYKPSVVGINCCAAYVDSVKNVARIVKENDKNVLVIVGGPHPTLVKGDLLADSNIDVAVVGEGEETLLEILETVKNNKPFDKVSGIVYRNGSKIVEASPRKRLDNLDVLSFPSEYAPHVLKEYKDYPKSAFNTLMLSRGCFGNCVFCGSRCVFGEKIRYRSVDNVIEELKSLTKMGIWEVNFVDDIFGADKEYTNKLSESIIQNLKGLRWNCYTRANLINEQLVALMKKAGCQSIAIGVESGNNDILRKMRKGITVQMAINAATIIKKYKIKLYAFYLIGFPGETEETLTDTFNTMKKVGGQIIYNIFTPYPGTAAFDLCQQKGLIGKYYDPSLFNHQSPENFFCPDLSKEKFREIASQIEKYVEDHNLKDYLQESKRNIFTPKSIKEIINRVMDYGLTGSLKRFVEIARVLIS
jgi:anaerobic magnesium-protoporphyrin IX monomethyl ester cyclase